MPLLLLGRRLLLTPSLRWKTLFARLISLLALFACPTCVPDTTWPDAGRPDAGDTGTDGGDARPRGVHAPITIDGRFDDWAEVPVAHSDARGDGQPAGLDIRQVKLAHDHRFLFLYFEVLGDLALNGGNNLTIALDTDDDASTGHPFEGIGAELHWRPGQQTGRFAHGGSEVEVSHRPLLFHAAPAFASTSFEIAFGREARPDGAHPLFPSTSFRIVIRDGNSGDRVPEEGRSLAYAFEPEVHLDEAPLLLDRFDDDHLRVVTYNVLNDMPWAEGQGEHFERQLAAVSPDVVALQEVRDHSPEVTARLVSRWTGARYNATGNGDCIILSVFPILEAHRIDGNIAALLDTEEVLGTPLLVINAHLPCCGENRGRQRESDQIVSFLREAREGRGVMDLAAGTPLIIVGDLNLVGSARPLRTLITGDIFFEDVFGPDFALDWDDSDLLDLVSRQTELRMGYTWRSDTGEYWPGQLDRIIFSDSVLDSPHNFVLCTQEMSEEALREYGLEADDSRASDHLLFCADFVPAS